MIENCHGSTVCTHVKRNSYSEQILWPSCDILTLILMVPSMSSLETDTWWDKFQYCERCQKCQNKDLWKLLTCSRSIGTCLSNPIAIYTTTMLQQCHLGDQSFSNESRFCIHTSDSNLCIWLTKEELSSKVGRQTQHLVSWCKGTISKNSS